MMLGLDNDNSKHNFENHKKYREISKTEHDDFFVYQGIAVISV